MLKPSMKITSTDLTQFLENKIAAFKIPQHFYLQYEKLPRIAAGKIAKKELRQSAIQKLNNI